jgi:hypothetical protein
MRADEHDNCDYKCPLCSHSYSDSHSYQIPPSSPQQLKSNEMPGFLPGPCISTLNARRNHPSPKQRTQHQMLKVNWHFYLNYRSALWTLKQPPPFPTWNGFGIWTCLDSDLSPYKGKQFLHPILKRSWVFPDNQTLSQLLKKLPTFYEPAAALCFPYLKLDEPKPHPTNQFLHHFLILFYKLHLFLLSNLLPLDFLKNSATFLSHECYMPYLSHCL